MNIRVFGFCHDNIHSTSNNEQPLWECASAASTRSREKRRNQKTSMVACACCWTCLMWARPRLDLRDWTYESTPARWP